MNSSIDDIKTILFKLQQLEILEYQEQNDLAQLTFLQDRKDVNNLHLNEKKWEGRKAYDSIKLSDIANYINQKKSCRSQLLLQYFGEKKSDKCGVCDICVIQKRNAIQDEKFNDISKKIKNLLRDTEMNLLEICNSISDVPEQEIINILNFLFDNDKIIKFGNKYQWKR